MGIGGFLASQAERDHYRFLKRHTSSRVLRSCEGEMEREVFAILGPAGVDEQTSRAVTKCLRDVEYDTSVDAGNPSLDEESQPLRWKSEVGLTHFLVKFGEGLGSSSPDFHVFTSLTIPPLNRGSAYSSPLHLSHNHWTRVPHRWDYTAPSLLLCRSCTCSLTLFMSCHGLCTAGLRGDQGQGHRGWKWSDGILAGCSEHVASGWSSGRCSIHFRGPS
jgi:hypothetical protein